MVGAGPAGLFTALLLRQRDIAVDVAVWERDREETAGFGVILPPEAVELIHRTASVLADELTPHLVHWRKTTVARCSDPPTVVPTPPLSAIARTALNQVLWEACGAAGVLLREREAPGLPALSAAYDLVVCADGAGSQAGAAGFEVKVQEVGPPYVWLGLDHAIDGMNFRVERTADGPYLAHAYPYSDSASTFLVEGPSPLRPDEIAALFDVSVRTSPERRNGNWRMFRQRTVRPWWRENVVLVGDAAHTVHYSVGYGTYLALRDAVSLVDQLAGVESTAAALAAYEQERRPAVEWSQLQGKMSAEWFAEVEDVLDLPPSRFAASLLTRGGRLQHPSAEPRRGSP